MKKEELRQGQVFTRKQAMFILDKCIDLKPSVNTSSDMICIVVISQDCDIVKCSDIEPYIEFVLGEQIKILDGNNCNGKNPRLLHIEETKVYWEFKIHNKFRIEKKSFTDKSLNPNFKLDSDNIDILKKWISKRYTRAAFPDEFNNRLGKNIDKLVVKKELSKKVSSVFIYVEDKEYPSDKKYEPIVLVVTATEVPDDEKEEIRNLYETGFCSTGIDPEIKVLTEEDITLRHLRKFKRWDKDSYSLTEGKKPVEYIDII